MHPETEIQSETGGLREPGIRVGVILPEDERTQLSLGLPAGAAFEISWDGGSRVLDPAGEPGSGLELMLTAGSEPDLSLAFESSQAVLRAGEWLTLTPVTPQRLIRGDGIRIRQVPAGRSFHFEKQIDQTLLGKLHFYRQDARIVVVNELPLEYYVACTVASEMSGDAPLGFLKAQAVAARSWACFNRFGKHGPLFSHCNDDCCQRYQGTGALTDETVRAVEETRGEILVNDRARPVNAYYSKCCGGITSSSATVRTGTLKSPRRLAAGMKDAIIRRIRPGRFLNFDRVSARKSSPDLPRSEHDAHRWIAGTWPGTGDLFCNPASFPGQDLNRFLGPVDEHEPWFRWRSDFAQAELVDALRDGGGIRDIASLTGLAPVQREASGRITRLEVRYLDRDGRSRTRLLEGQYAIRKALSRTFLRSSAFVVEPKPGDNGSVTSFTLRGAGWGHGVGLCQLGAVGMALSGFSYVDILRHYFRNARIAGLDPVA